MRIRAAKSTPPVLLVIGAHRDELAFGERVSHLLDPQRFSVLRIHQGISGERPRADQRQDFRKRHRDLYLQILQHIRPGQQLMIDLHQGVDSGGLGADVLCANQTLLQRICPASGPFGQDERTWVRCIHLVSDTAVDGLTADDAPDILVTKPDIPEVVWNHPETHYVGLEIYLSRAGLGGEEEQRFARTLVEQIADKTLG